MDLIVHAIVLRRRDAGESDRRLTLLTQELGRIDAVAKGARKAASRLAGSSDPLSVAVMNLAAGKRNRFVTQSQPITSFRGLRTDYDRLNMALSLAELFAAVMPEEQPDPDAYDLLLRSLAFLESHSKPLVALVWAQVQLLSNSGFFPNLETCVVTDAPVGEADPSVSPQAGGYLSPLAEGRFHDRVRTKAEVLLNIRRIVELEHPPANLRFCEETLALLMHFWRGVAAIPLPANEGLLNETLHLK